MKSLSVYRKEFSHVIILLARMLYDYEETLNRFEESGGKVVIRHTNKAGAVNGVKNPYYQTLEGLRISILSYARELGLTPAGLKKINDASIRPEKHSVLAEALLSLGNHEEAPPGKARTRKVAANGG